MIETHALPDEVQSDGRQARRLIGREAEADSLRAYLATARSHCGTLFVTGEPGVGKTELVDSVSNTAAAAGPHIVRAARAQFEAGGEGG